MNIELKPFQEIAARQMREDIESARQEAARGRAQAIVLASPTGSGKTVTITALMEMIQVGFESFPADPRATFLWLSDSPELNVQGRNKILSQSSVFQAHELVIVEPPFSQKELESGKIYFLNTQKLGSGSLLTKTGDGRDYTIWNAIQNTSTSKPGHFYLIIDEAHRGMKETRHNLAQAESIVQRFIKGYPEGGMDTVKLVIGMSATPQRFQDLLLGTNRVRRECVIDPRDVRESGLLKDKIILTHNDEDQPAESTLLQTAAERWKQYTSSWQVYCDSQTIPVVKPVLVLQVEDGSGVKLTNTNLQQIITVVERITGSLPADAWAHAFEDDKPIVVAGREIRKIDASKIQDDPNVLIVLFKMSLTTGWDCPRAEVMMSYRRAKDHTLIAQLVGRMVRTPLARTIESEEFLNTVSLYLPRYDRKGVKAIIDKLEHPDPESGVGTDVIQAGELVTYARDESKAACFEKLATLPTYRIERTPKLSNVRRLIKLARRLTLNEIDLDAWTDAQAFVVELLTAELNRLQRDPDFIGNLGENAAIEVREVWLTYGEWQDLEISQTLKLTATPENIEDLFEKCERLLGEGLHIEFWRAHKDLNNPYRAKLELYGILQDKIAWQTLERECGTRVTKLFGEFDHAINALPSSRREAYNLLHRVAKTPEPEPLPIYDAIETRSQQRHWKKHIYTSADLKFGWDADGWEEQVLEEELERRDPVGWLRNIDRKPWALSIPYELGEWQSLYPDLLIFREENGSIVVDILDPHTTSLADAVAKAKGLAAYAAKHGKHFARIELIAKFGDKLRRLNFQSSKIRDQVYQVVDKPALDKLFQDYG